MNISGYTVAYRAVAGDYCLRECVLSMLPLCDEVVVGYATSDDGTGEVLADLQREHPKVRVVERAWVQPVGEPTWFVKWVNEVRSQLRGNCQLMLDADEVLDDGEYTQRVVKDAAKRRVPLWFHRINYIRNCRTVIAAGETCGTNVVRCGPVHFWMPSDEPYVARHLEPPIRHAAEDLNPQPVIHHYGFLRRSAGMFAKSKVGLQAFFGGYDQRLAAAEAEGKEWWETCPHEQPYTAYEGRQPECAQAWLKERGVL